MLLPFFLSYERFRIIVYENFIKYKYTNNQQGGFDDFRF